MSADKSSTNPIVAPELMARVRQVQIRTHRLISGVLQGSYRSNFRGTGIEFEEVRPYQPGDEVRSIDWNVTARTGEAHIKTYHEDRQLVLQLLVDTSRSMDFGSGEKSKRESAAEFAALLSFVAANNQDQVGLSLFAEDTGTHLRPDKGHRHVLRIVREVVAAQADGQRSNLAHVLEDQLRHMKRRSLIMLVSDFLEIDDDGWEDELAHVARRHDLICVRIYDPFEEELPEAGILLMRDVETGREVEVDTRSRAVRDEWKARATERRNALLQKFKQARVDVIEVSTTEDVADPVIRCFQRRARGGMLGGLRT